MCKVYLAGPEVFLPNAAEIGAAKKRICAAHGLTGLFPLDQQQPPLPPAELGTAIYRANVALMTQADAIIANLTPFRGAAMDVGTAFELGFCAARGIKLFGYANVRALPTKRVPHTLKNGIRLDDRGWIVEDFGFFENLMIEVPVRAFGPVFTGDVPDTEILTDLSAFERTVRHAATFWPRV
jgi:nucleoside 2-deoxyribosyltransferase